MLLVTTDIQIPDDELEFTFVRSSGPGGQNVNKVNSKAVLRWNLATNTSVPEAVRDRFVRQFASRLTETGELLITSQKFRDQPRNQQDCLDKLREMLLSVARPPKRRKKTRPTRSSIERRKQEKRETSHKKQARRWRGDD